MGTDPNDAGADKQYSGYPWGWQNSFLSHYSGLDAVLVERMTCLDTCKQRLHKSAAEFEARCKYHGLRCEYRHMANQKRNFSGTDLSLESEMTSFVQSFSDTRRMMEVCSLSPRSSTEQKLERPPC